MPLDVSRVAVTGVWFRHVPSGSDPLWSAPHPADGRWQTGGVVEGFYLADEAATAWAEWYRALAEHGLQPVRALPRDLWRFEVAVDGVADLSGRAALAEVGLGVPSPDPADWPAFQEVGAALHAEGCRGVLAPSAARPDRRVLCLFRPAPSLAGVTALRPPETVRNPPVPPRGMRT